MAGTIHFGCTALPMGRKGIIKKNDDGSYQIVVGGLNAYNSSGLFYLYDAVRNLFEDSSIFQRRVAAGVCKGELGHPKFLPGMTQPQFFNRVATIEETNVCCLHRKITLDFDNYRDESGRPFIAVISNLTPSGPHGPALERSLENPGENVCFSIRTFAHDVRNVAMGRTERLIDEIITFDQVTEPGIASATLFKSPAMESFEHTFTRGSLIQAVREAEESAVAMESNSPAVVGTRLLDLMGYEFKPEQPLWTSWRR